LLIAHLSDSHIRDADDVTWLERQLDCIAARKPDHLAITGDLLDRWSPKILDRALDALDARGFLHRDRVTILHGNHDFASSGGHPRRNADLWRLIARFWDPPPLITWRRRRFYGALARRAQGLGADQPFLKVLPNGLRIAVIDSVPVAWRTLRFEGHAMVVTHAVGRVRLADASWLAGLPHEPGPLVLLLHHYPLANATYEWSPQRWQGPSFKIRVPVEIPNSQRRQLWDAAHAARVRLVMCGHLHRARLEYQEGIAVGLNGQSGAAWAGRTIAWYELSDRDVVMTLETVAK
jgi:3',5'-cyclic AMP phosphodiesterase CpdA